MFAVSVDFVARVLCSSLFVVVLICGNCCACVCFFLFFQGQLSGAQGADGFGVWISGQ